ncbi:MAG TPA: antirestriction protein [Candidatus Sulfotelmatobacter sp.]
MNTFTHAAPVAENRRLNFLPKMFGTNYFLNGEASLFDFAHALMPDYAGGHWEFFHRTGDGVHFAVPNVPDASRLCVSGNYFDREVSAQAAGIILSLFALNAMAHRASSRGDETGTDFLADRYYALRDYAKDHPDRAAIFAAID